MEELLALDQEILKSTQEESRHYAILKLTSWLHQWAQDLPLLTAAMSKLGSYWHTGDNNLRYTMLIVAKEASSVLNESSLTNKSQYLSMFASVLDSNDPVARALTFR